MYKYVLSLMLATLSLSNFTWAQDINGINGQRIHLPVSSLKDPVADTNFNVSAFKFTFNWGAATGSSNLFTLKDTANNTGTGTILNVAQGVGSASIPFLVSANGNNSSLSFIDNNEVLTGKGIGWKLVNTNAGGHTWHIYEAGGALTFYDQTANSTPWNWYNAAGFPGFTANALGRLAWSNNNQFADQGSVDLWISRAGDGIAQINDGGGNPASLNLKQLNIFSQTAPATPASGQMALYEDSSTLALSAKNAAGTVFVGVTPKASTAHQWFNSLGANGSLTSSQPAATDLSDWFTPPTSAVSGLPSASTNNGKMFIVTDGGTGTDCTTGGGALKVWCYSNGTTWVSVGGAAGGGSTAYTAPETGAVATTVSTKLDETLNVVNDFGAVGNGQVVTDGHITNGSNTVTSASAVFTSGDVGKSIWIIEGSGTIDATTISAFTNSTTISVTTAPTVTSTSAYISWGTDDTAAFQAAINGSAAKGKILRIPNTGKRYIVGPITVGSNARIQFDSGAAIQIRSGMTSNQVLLGLTAASNVQIVGNTGYIYAPSPEYTSEYNHCIAMYAAAHVLIEGINVDGCGGDAIYIADNGGTTYTQNVVIDHVEANAVHRNGISIISGKSIFVSNSTFTNNCCDGNDPSYNNPGVDIEPNNGSNVLQDIHFKNIHTSGNKGSGINFTLTNMGSGTLPISIQGEDVTSDGDGFGAMSTQCEPVSPLSGQISFNNVASYNAKSFGLNLINYSISCPVLSLNNVNVLNPNSNVSAQEAINTFSGGGNTVKYGNIDLNDITIIDNRGTSKITWYYQVADFSNNGVSNFHFKAKYLSGAVHGSATEGQGASLEEPQLMAGATPIYDASLGTPNVVWHKTLAGNVTGGSMINLIPGQIIRLEVCQPSGQSYTFTPPTNMIGYTTGTIAANKCRRQTFTVEPDGSTVAAVSAGVDN